MAFLVKLKINKTRWSLQSTNKHIHIISIIKDFQSLLLLQTGLLIYRSGKIIFNLKHEYRTL